MLFENVWLSTESPHKYTLLSKMAKLLKLISFKFYEGMLPHIAALKGISQLIADVGFHQFGTQSGVLRKFFNADEMMRWLV